MTEVGADVEGLRLDLQPASQEIYETKYMLKGRDSGINGTYLRVAKVLAEVDEVSPTDFEVDEYYKCDKYEVLKSFIWAMENGAIPAGRIMSNAGAEAEKSATSLINCTVSGTVPDSIDGILDTVKQAGNTLKAGCGIGYDFSTLRNSGAYVSGAGAETSGVLSFMDVFDKMCFTIASAGGRRGAQMATMNMHHPNIIDFIKAKREDGRLRQFNLSLLICDEFVNAHNTNTPWVFSHPINDKHDFQGGEGEDVDLESPDVVEKLSELKSIIWRKVARFEDDGYIENEHGEVACLISGDPVPTEDIWDLIMKSTYDYAEPGFIMIDEVNRMNNLWFCEDIRTTNPCGEQPLPPYGSCLLGSINLTRLVVNPFTPEAYFDWERYKKVIKVFTRMLDNVCEVSRLPLKNQREELERKRRHGMGYLGLGSTITMLGMSYGDNDSLEFTSEVSKLLAVESWRAGVDLAIVKGVAPIMHDSFTVSDEMKNKFPPSLDIEVGKVVRGLDLFVHSRHIQRIRGEDPELYDKLVKHGSRFTHATSIAPTGTISLSLANNASNGIEPSFSHHYKRNVIKAERKSKEMIDVFSFELLAYRELINPNAMPFLDPSDGNALPDNFSDSSTIDPMLHIDIQARAQWWVDSSISKTINVPTDYDFEEFKGLYDYAIENGLKGCTTFRFNPEAFQGVLVTQSDLDGTSYTFKWKDKNGEIVETTATGSEEIEYDGETHTAANLFDALKEGYYGKI